MNHHIVKGDAKPVQSSLSSFMKYEFVVKNIEKIERKKRAEVKKATEAKKGTEAKKAKKEETDEKPKRKEKPKNEIIIEL